ncbi:NUDIX domain-containing protein [Actinopolymorpha pittospori]
MTKAWLSPSEFVQSLPKATVYACLYFTDESGRPLQLRSSYGVARWQVPGGNMDDGETPWQTAVRETREETGLVITKQCPLLLTHFITPRHNWPHSHIGFLFDGGTLTADQLEHIVLDPNEHTEWKLQSLAEWENHEGISQLAFARLKALDAARRSGVAGYLETVH